MKSRTIHEGCRTYRRISEMTAKRLYGEGETVYITSALSSVPLVTINGEFEKITNEMKMSFCDKKTRMTRANYFIEMR